MSTSIKITLPSKKSIIELENFLLSFSKKQDVDMAEIVQEIYKAKTSLGTYLLEKQDIQYVSHIQDYPENNLDSYKSIVLLAIIIDKEIENFLPENGYLVIPSKGVNGKIPAFHKDSKPGLITLVEKNKILTQSDAILKIQTLGNT